MGYGGYYWGLYRDYFPPFPTKNQTANIPDGQYSRLQGTWSAIAAISSCLGTPSLCAKLDLMSWCLREVHGSGF